MRTEKQIKRKALEIVEGLNHPFLVNDVAKALGISWATARQLLMELTLEGSLELEKTSRFMVFRYKACREGERSE